MPANEGRDLGSGGTGWYRGGFLGILFTLESSAGQALRLPAGELPPRPTPLWIPAFAGMTRVGERGRREGETAPHRAPALGSRFRGNDDGGVRVSRPWAVVGGPLAAPRRGGCGPPAHPSISLRANGLPGPALVILREPQGERPALPRTAPLDSCLRRNDSCGGVRGLREMETPLAAPLPWVPAFARTTMGVCGLASADGVGGGGPAVAGRAFCQWPLRLGWWGGPLAAPPRGGCGPHVPPSISLRANGLPGPAPVTLRQAQGERSPRSCAGHSSMALGRTVSPAPPLWIPASAGMTRVGRRLGFPVGFHVVLGVEAYLVFGVGDVPELPGVVGDAEVGGGAEGVGGHDAALD